jgi:mycobactin lysine-N-oxygenase
MLSNFSWQSFQIASGRYQQWIDRGELRPTHGEWQEYLQWAKDKCPDVNFPLGEVKSIRAADQWTVVTDRAGNFLCKRLVVTGPGRPVTVPIVPATPHARVLNGHNFWHELHKLNDFFALPSDALEDHSLAVIGSGGTAATIVAGLSELTNAPINVISRTATLNSRGESYFELRWLSDPWDWTQLPLNLRRVLIGRIDRGVISAQNMRILNNAQNVIHQRMSASQIEIRSDMPWIVGEVEVFDPVTATTSNVPIDVPSDFVVDAGGFDSWWFADLFVGELRQAFADSTLKSVMETFIDDQLGIPFNLTIDRLQAAGVDTTVANKYLSSHPCRRGLYLGAPMLAGLAQGPGFPNLTCLGLLSNRILEHFVE